MTAPRPDETSDNRFRAALLRAKAATATAFHGTWGAIRRHPWRTVFALPAAAVLYVAALYPFTPSIGDIRKAKLEQPTVVLSSDGKELAVFKRANRDWVKLTDISPHVIDALLATEDHRFYSHHGFDVARTAKAALNTVGGDRQGGSTLTQQLARNLYPEEVGRAPTVTRKVKELITALKIEAVYTKKEILETYLNTVPFLYNAYGIEMAARTYFDKSAEKLDVAEAATLVGMLKGTSYYNPVLAPDRAVTRRNTVLAQMARHGKLTEGQFETLAKKPLKIDFERQPEFGGMAPHLAQNIKRWLIDWADRNDYNIYADGLVVRTTIDSRMQQAANEIVEKQGQALQKVADVEWGKGGGGFSTDPATYASQHDKVQPFAQYWSSNKGMLQTFLRETAEYKALREQGLAEGDALAQLQADEKFMSAFRKEKTRIEAGFLAIDPNNGHVRAWVGSRDYQVDKFDHVVQARRQPGSTFKPFVYAAAFEAGARPTDTYMDQAVEIQVDRNQVWRPTDMHGTTNAPMTLREGLVKSKNTITVQVMQQVGASRVASLAKSMGVRDSSLQAVPSLALGTSPVTLREMVTSYATIANGGRFMNPIVVTRVEDRSGNVLEQFQDPAGESALTSETAQQLLDVMRGVIDEGTAVGMRPRFGIPADMDLAGKTGTTQKNTDGWFIAMHPQLVMGAWMGFNDNRVSMRSEYWGQGAHNALFIVGDFIKASLSRKLIDPKVKFAVPKGASKGQEGSVWDPIVGRVNDWWNSMFAGSSTGGTQTAAVAPTTPVPLPPPPPVASMQQPVVIPEPMRLPDSGVLAPAQPRAPETILGAPAPRAPDAVIPAPPSYAPPTSSPPTYAPPTYAPPSSPPPSYTPEVARAVPGGRRSTPQVIEIEPSGRVISPPSSPPSGTAASSGPMTWSAPPSASSSPAAEPQRSAASPSIETREASSSSASANAQGTAPTQATGSAGGSAVRPRAVEVAPSSSVVTAPASAGESQSSPPVGAATGSATGSASASD